MDAYTLNAIIGVLGVLVLALLGGFVWIYVRRRSKRSKPKARNAVLGMVVRDNRATPITNYLEANITMPPKEEFEELESNDERRRNLHYTDAQGRRYNSKINVKLNQDPSVIPYDHNSVQLRSPINGCDYINCTWITRVREDSIYDNPQLFPYLSCSNISFVVAQDPMKHTVGHHYQMISEQHVDFIIKLVNKQRFILDNRGTKERIGSMTVEIKRERIITDYLSQQEFEISNSTGAAQCKHGVVLFQIIRESEYGTAGSDDTGNLLRSICVIRKDIGLKKNFITIMVQDEKGGPNGADVFVTLYQLLEKFDEALSLLEYSPNGEQRINVFQTVDNIKKMRMKMISTYELYKYVHQCLGTYFQNKCDIETFVANYVSATTSMAIERDRTTNQSRGNTRTIPLQNDTISLESVYVDTDTLFPPDKYVLTDETASPERQQNRMNENN